MKRLILAFVLLSSGAMAQTAPDPTVQAFQDFQSVSTSANHLFEEMKGMAAKIDALEKENAALKARPAAPAPVVAPAKP